MARTAKREARSRRFLAALVLLAAWNIVWAMEEITPQEMALLPSYCNYTQGFSGAGTAGDRQWRAVYGEAFHSFHHYCYSMVYLMRADRHATPRNERASLLGQAFREISYVTRHTPSTHPLLPEMLTKQGMIQRRLGKPNEALPFLEKAAELNPKYWRAYSELAMSYVALDNKSKARDVLKQGLAHTPDAKALTALLNTLGGQKRPESSAPDTTAPVGAARLN